MESTTTAATPRTGPTPSGSQQPLGRDNSSGDGSPTDQRGAKATFWQRCRMSLDTSSKMNYSKASLALAFADRRGL